MAWVVVVALVVVAAIVTLRSPMPTRDLPPDFAMVAYQGQDRIGQGEIRFHALVGRGTPVVLNFWAASCPPCKNEMLGFQSVADEVGDAVLIVSVDVGALMFPAMYEDARAFLAQVDVRYPVAYAVDEDVVRDYEVYGLPATLFFRSDGRQMARHGGLVSEADFRAYVTDLLRDGD